MICGLCRFYAVVPFSSQPSSQEVEMASIVANLPPTALGLGLSKPIPKSFSRHSNCSISPGHQRRIVTLVKAIGDASESSSSLSIIESVQNVWEQPEDRIAIVGLGFAAVTALWTYVNIVSKIWPWTYGEVWLTFHWNCSQRGYFSSWSKKNGSVGPDSQAQVQTKELGQERSPMSHKPVK